MRLRTPAALQAIVLGLLSKGISRNRIATVVGLSRSTVQRITKNGVVIKPPTKSKKYSPSIVPSIFADTESKRCIACGKMMMIGFEDSTCFECETIEDKHFCRDCKHSFVECSTRYCIKQAKNYVLVDPYKDCWQINEDGLCKNFEEKEND